jgi:hypothetical protein
MSDKDAATLGPLQRRFQGMPDKYRALFFLFFAAAVCLVAGCSADPFADEVSAEDERVMRTMVDISCKLGVEHIVIADRPAVLAHDDSSWDHFMARFAGAHSVMRISLPVYSRDGNRAVVHTTGDCPYRCGTGFYHELEKTFDGWRIAKSAIAWTA